MRKPFTPKQVSLAIGVSESSIKRWCDNGSISAQYTTGGHRRITTSGLLIFLRSSRHDLSNPTAIGLPERLPITTMPREELLKQIVESLVAGNETEVQQIAIELFLNEHSVAKICDDFIAPALRQVGGLWKCSKIEVYQERLACKMSQQILAELKSLVPVPSQDALVAIGGAPQGDQYSLPSSMVELTLRSCGWQSTSMGENVPLASLAAAVRTYSPKLFWLSASHLESENRFVIEFNQLYNEFGSQIPFVVGGQALTAEVRSRLPDVTFCSSLYQLTQHATVLSGQTGY